MSHTIQIASGLWQIKLGVVNAYLLQSEDGLILVDSGYPDSTEKIFAAVKETGHDPSNIRHLILTHGHIDHAGSAAKLRSLTGARTYAHPIDLELFSKGEAERPGTKLTPGMIPAIVYFLFIKFSGTKYEPVPIDHLVKDGEMIPLAGGIEVVHAPGHCAGQIALLLQKENILIAGDICSHVKGLGFSVLNEDRAMAKATILRIAKLPFNRAVFGHGGPLNERANLQLKERFERINP